jgi:hypothetical protein
VAEHADASFWVASLAQSWDTILSFCTKCVLPCYTRTRPAPRSNLSVKQPMWLLGAFSPAARTQVLLCKLSQERLPLITFGMPLKPSSTSSSRKSFPARSRMHSTWSATRQLQRCPLWRQTHFRACCNVFEPHRLQKRRIACAIKSHTPEDS